MPRPARSAAATAGRILALSVILISIAPLASIYRIFSVFSTIDWHYTSSSSSSSSSPSFVYLEGSSNSNAAGASPHGKLGTTHRPPPATPSSSSSSSLHAILHNTNATVDQLVNAFFKDALAHQSSIDGTGTILFMGTGVNNIPFVRMHHFSLIVPWFISVVVGVIVPGILTVLSCLQGQQRRRRRRAVRRDTSDWEEQQGEEGLQFISCLSRRKHKWDSIKMSLRHYKKTINDDDIIDSSKGDDDKSSDQNRILSLDFPLSSIEDTGIAKMDHKRREAPAMCAVCLTQYDVGDVVVWSSNKDCQHVFHEKCIMSWLMRDKKQCCPCCRQEFIDPNAASGFLNEMMMRKGR